MKLKHIHIAELAKQHAGIFNASDLTKAGLSFKQIRHLSTTGVLEKIARGMYRFPQQSYDERLEIARRIPNGVFCLYSACFLHGLSDFVPSEQHLAVPKKSRYVLPEYPPVKLYFWQETAHQLGIMEFNLSEGSIKVYNPEKTICDVCRLREKIGVDVLKEILKNYLQRPNRDLAKLYEYARLLRVEKTINTYLTILL